MQRITSAIRRPLHDVPATRALEHAAAASLPPHTLMRRAGQASAQLALALAPHARCIWIACGAGNNGGDGLEAAALLRRAGHPVCVSLLGDPAHLPPDAAHSLQRARDAGVPFISAPPPLSAQDLGVDALFGIGLTSAARARPADQRLREWMARLRTSPATTLCIDLPSGLIADTGQWAPGFEDTPTPDAGARHTLSLLTLKPGLFTAHGRDAAGTVWLDTLEVDASAQVPSAWLVGAPPISGRAHASHKGSFGDVAVIGGEGLAARGMGMTGAAVLAALAALHGGAGRVLLALLDNAPAVALAPELMLRRIGVIDLERTTVVCGCGGGEAVAPELPRVLTRAPRLVLDADALNAVAADPALQALLRERATHPGWATVLTPHPLEAARLLSSTSAAVQSDRLAAARALAEDFGCVVALKGSGSVIATPGEAPRINPTGNARLATAGTGDVLAGLVGARLAAAHDNADVALDAACGACWLHGAIADEWPARQALTASALARALHA